MLPVRHLHVLAYVAHWRHDDHALYKFTILTMSLAFRAAVRDSSVVQSTCRAAGTWVYNKHIAQASGQGSW